MTQIHGPPAVSQAEGMGLEPTAPYGVPQFQ